VFVLATIIALDGVLHPQAGLPWFIESTLKQLLRPAWTAAWTAAWGALMLGGWVFPGVRRWVARPATLGMLACALALWAAWPLLAPARLDPAAQYEARYLDLLVPVMLLPAALVAAYRPAWLAPARDYLVRLSAGLLLVQSLWHIGATWQWQGYVGLWRGLLASHSGPFVLADTPFARPAVGGQALRFDWTWANPSLSLALSTDGRVRSIILCENQDDNYFAPFAPLNPRGLPDLSRYGIDYTSYQAALASITQNKTSKPAKPKAQTSLSPAANLN
jgi:hypothetical protein